MKASKNCKFGMGRRGVSPVIGAVMLFAIAVLTIGILQIQLVPSMCKSKEAKNALKVAKSLEEFTNELSEGKRASITVDTAHYTKYPFLLTPPDPALVVKVEPLNISVNYTVVLPNGTIMSRNVTVRSSRLIVENLYYYYPVTKYIYENSALFEVEGNKSITLIPPSIDNSTIRFVVVNSSSKSFATNAPVSLQFSPVSEGEFYAKNITISFKSVCPDGWKDFAEVSGNTVTLKGEGVRVLVYQYTEGNYAQSTSYGNYILLPTGGSNYTLSVNGSIMLSVMAVRPDLLTGVPGVKVNVTATGGKLSSTSLTTDQSGIATVEFTASEAGTYVITFNASGEIVKYTVFVKQTPGFYNTYWLDKDKYNGMTISSVTPLYAKVTKNGQPVANTMVYFGVNNSSVVDLVNYTVYYYYCMGGGYYYTEYSAEYYNYTNSSGIASVYVLPKENGTVSIYCYSGGSGDKLVLKVRVSGT
jgi:flagellin-like protein